MSDGAGHLGEEISALLDGELGPDAERRARAHLDGCPACRAELTAISEVRAVVRALPVVEPRAGFDERIRELPDRRDAVGRRRGALGALAGAAAAAALLVAVANPASQPVDPQVGDLVDRHAATASAGGDPVTQFVPVGVPLGFDR